MELRDPGYVLEKFVLVRLMRLDSGAGMEHRAQLDGSCSDVRSDSLQGRKDKKGGREYKKAGFQIKF